MNLMDYIALDEERSKMNGVHKLGVGDKFTVDAEKWEEQFGLISNPYNYAYTNNGRIILKLIGVGNINTKKHWWEFWKRKKKVYEFEVIDLVRYEE